eukprot:CAMPEP_0171862806 /NCGR_PEP_ID=MMETSP0992-20121227/27895_1 /TAXON_ID=483369 /ORGANISM="non described non described, Strain CCMP2098" /LENGTH=36 /DNA_ID= /DNA_START= /DNA_END= /DNA_ORIENTATION=
MTVKRGGDSPRPRPPLSTPAATAAIADAASGPRFFT